MSKMDNSARKGETRKSVQGPAEARTELNHPPRELESLRMRNEGGALNATLQAFRAALQKAQVQDRPAVEIQRAPRSHSSSASIEPLDIEVSDPDAHIHRAAKGGESSITHEPLIPPSLEEHFRQRDQPEARADGRRYRQFLREGKRRGDNK